MEGYNSDHNGYGSMTLTALQTGYDQGVKNVTILSASSGASATYCVKSVAGNATAWKAGPAADIVVNPASAPCS
jgi:hypothetical protein